MSLIELLKNYCEFAFSTASDESKNYNDWLYRKNEVYMKYDQGKRLHMLETAVFGIAAETNEFLLANWNWLIGENKEFDLYHAKRELGDILWYVMQYVKYLGSDFKFDVYDYDGKIFIGGDMKDNCHKLLQESTELLEQFKKIMLQGKSLENMKFDIMNFLDIIFRLSDNLCSNPEEIIMMNIEKLEKRYPNGFETIRSEVRNKDDI